MSCVMIHCSATSRAATASVVDGTGRTGSAGMSSTSSSVAVTYVAFAMISCSVNFSVMVQCSSMVDHSLMKAPNV